MIIVGDFKTPFTLKDRSIRQKINMETLAFHNISEYTKVIDIYRIFHTKTIALTFFLSAHGTGCIKC